MIVTAPRNVSLGNTLNPSKIIEKTIEYIFKTIDSFPEWFKNGCSAYYNSKEDIFNVRLAEFLTCNMSNSSTIETIYFSHQPATEKRSLPDIGVCLASKSGPSNYFFYIEGKRLPAPEKEREKEYVCGNQGGIERFKTNKHAPNLQKSAMVGYVQREDFVHWENTINSYIEELAGTNNFWSNSEKLRPLKKAKNKFISIHKRIEGDDIQLYHMWLDLTEN